MTNREALHRAIAELLANNWREVGQSPNRYADEIIALVDVALGNAEDLQRFRTAAGARG